MARSVEGDPMTAGRGARPMPDGATPSSARTLQARRELAVGSGLTLIMVIGGIYLAIWPGSGWFDRLVLDVVHVHKGAAFVEVTRVRYPVVVVAGVVILAAVTVRRDRARALACLVGPPLALVTCELVAKPLVGRTLGGALSYPSGTVVAAASLATAIVLVAPARWRLVATVVAGGYAVWTTLAVIALQWHLPSDALAGLSYGVGVVLVVDGAAWFALEAVGRRVDGRRRSAPTPR